MRHPIAAAVAVAMAATGPDWLGAQAPQEPQVVRETVDVTLVEVPVRVLDRSGEPVRDLTAADFALADDGRPQTITAFDAIEMGEHVRPAPAAFSPAARRRYLLLFDLTFARPKSLVAARRAAKEFVLSGMGDADLAAVGTFSVETGVRLVVTFCSDRVILARAIENFGLEAADRSDPLRFEYRTKRLPPTVSSGETSGRDRQGDSDARNQPDYAEMTSAAESLQRAQGDDYERGRVRSLIQGFRDLGRVLDVVEGRKDIVFLSEGFPSRLLVGTRESLEEHQWRVQGDIWKVESDRRFGNAALRSDLSDMGQFLQRTHCVIHTVDIAGFATEAGGETPSQPGLALPRNTENALFDLSNETGGESFQTTNDIEEQLRRLARRTSVVYVLGYRPDRRQGEGKYHALKVQVGRSGVKVVARPGYFERADFRQRTPLERSLSAADVIANEIPFAEVTPRVLAAPFAEPAAGAGPAEAPAALVSLMIEVPGAALLEGDKGERTSLEIYAYAFGEGRLGDYAAESFGIDLKKAREKLLRGGVRYFGEIHLPAGDYRLRTLVRNANTGRMGLTVTPLRVPAFGANDPFLLPPVFLETASAEWVAVRGGGAARAGGAGRTPAALASFAGLGGENVVPSATPRLAPGATARVCIVAYHFSTPGGRQDTFKIGTQLLDAEGRPLSAGNVSLVGKTPTEADGRRVFVLAFTTPSEIAPGRYGLRVFMEDGATAKPRQASASFVVP